MYTVYIHQFGFTASKIIGRQVTILAIILIQKNFRPTDCGAKIVNRYTFGLGDLIAYNRALFFFGIINAHTEPTPKYMFMDHTGTVPVL